MGNANSGVDRYVTLRRALGDEIHTHGLHLLFTPFMPGEAEDNLQWTTLNAPLGCLLQHADPPRLPFYRPPSRNR